MADRIAGRATPDGTARRAGDRPGYRPLGRTGLTVSAVGFGGYRTGRDDPDHRAALRAALAAGVNLIDTSSNYALGDSERLVGEVLAEGAVPRDEVVVVTKIGYVQGPNLDLARARAAEGRPFPEMVEYMDGCWHCIHPEFLADQLGRALDRLGLETVDVLLLHNPEYFLSDAAQRSDGRPLEDVRAAFYDRLARAFAYLDGAVADGRIGRYGVSSNTCVSPADDPEATSVARMHAASDGRMAVLQLPYNLFEPGALLEPNTPEGSALDAARDRGLGVLVNRPLNAMARQAGGQGRLVRLADPPRPDAPGGDATLRARVSALLSLEGLLAEAFPEVHGPRVAPLLLERWDEIGYPQAWAQIFRHELIPEARRGLGALVSWMGGRPDAERVGLLQAYQDALNGLVEPLQARATRQPPEVAARVRAAIEPHLPPALRGESLSRIALQFAASTPGVACVLNGMRHPAYVEDAAGILGLPPIPDVAAVARALA
jgi:uncharacterized protein